MVDVYHRGFGMAKSVLVTAVLSCVQLLVTET